MFIQRKFLESVDILHATWRHLQSKNNITKYLDRTFIVNEPYLISTFINLKFYVYLKNNVQCELNNSICGYDLIKAFKHS